MKYLAARPGQGVYRAAWDGGGVSPMKTRIVLVASLALSVTSLVSAEGQAAENATNFYILGLRPLWRASHRRQEPISQTSTIFMTAARVAMLLRVRSRHERDNGERPACPKADMLNDRSEGQTQTPLPYTAFRELGSGEGLEPPTRGL